MSTNYTCHAWVDNIILVCTDVGELHICYNTGDYMAKLVDSPLQGFDIMSVCVVRDKDFLIVNRTGHL